MGCFGEFALVFLFLFFFRQRKAFWIGMAA